MSRILLIALALTAILTPAHSEESEPEAQTLLLRQLDEERLAYQLYTELGTLYPELRQFQNIPRAERRHFNALATYTRSKFPETRINPLTGDFLFPDTQVLYTKLLKEGKQSTKAALNAGVQVEELDIRDLDEALAQSPEDSLRRIYENLRRGSKKHLHAFSKSGGQQRGNCCKGHS